MVDTAICSLAREHCFQLCQSPPIKDTVLQGPSSNFQELPNLVPATLPHHPTAVVRQPHHQQYEENHKTMKKLVRVVQGFGGRPFLPGSCSSRKEAAGLCMLTPPLTLLSECCFVTDLCVLGVEGVIFGCPNTVPANSRRLGGTWDKWSLW